MVRAFVFFIILTTQLSVLAQVPSPSYKDTTVKVYESTLYRDTLRFKNLWGINILVMSNGYGLGFVFMREINYHFSAGLTTYFSYIKDEQEIEYYDIWTGKYYTPGKINRVFVFPLFVVFEHHLFRHFFTDNIRFSPFVGAGVGLIFTTPYEIDFFRSFKFLKTYYEPAISLGFNARFGLTKKTYQGICIHYYFVKNSHGIASMINKPFTNLGSWAIVITMGYRF